MQPDRAGSFRESPFLEQLHRTDEYERSVLANREMDNQGTNEGAADFHAKGG